MNGVAADASGRNWAITINSIECEAAQSAVTLGTRIRYLGPRGPVEAPVSQLADASGKPHLPKSLVWKSGSRPLAELLSSGGVRNIQSENSAEIQLRFSLREAAGDLQLEFGDIPAFSLSRKRSGCQGLFRVGQIAAPRVTRTKPAASKPDIRVYRNAYACVSQGTVRTMQAEHPPYLPRQLLLFGRGYMPSARQVELPMGKALAQPYAYAEEYELNAIEQTARRVVGQDFPQYAAAATHYAFNWGPQKSQSGNELFSVGLYDLRPCPR